MLWILRQIFITLLALLEGIGIRHTAEKACADCRKALESSLDLCLFRHSFFPKGLSLVKVFSPIRRGGGPSQSLPMINENIRFEEVRLINSNGESVGVVPIDEALRMAAEVSLDLVLISSDALPPVCKLLDYGKYRYEQQKKKLESRKNQKLVCVKEIQVRPFIGDNDLLVKCRAIKKFIEEDGDKVKIVLRFRGRELSRQELGYEIIRRILAFCQDFAKEESEPKLEGSVITTILSKK
jgi:translation initiation factor IF-3